MYYPAENYQPTPRAYAGLSELEYPFHDRTIAVTMCGRVCFGSRKINLSTLKVLPMSSVQVVTDVSGTDLIELVGVKRFVLSLRCQFECG